MLTNLNQSLTHWVGADGAIHVCIIFHRWSHAGLHWCRCQRKFRMPRSLFHAQWCSPSSLTEVWLSECSSWRSSAWLMSRARRTPALAIHTWRFCYTRLALLLVQRFWPQYLWSCSTLLMWDCWHLLRACVGRLLEIEVYQDGHGYSMSVWPRRSVWLLQWVAMLIWDKVDPHTSLPIRSILITSFISLLLSLVILGSSTAFNDLVSLSVSGLQSSYLVAISLLLYRRSTGSIQTLPPSTSTISYPTSADLKLKWGPWHIPGYSGLVNNTFACAYLTIVVFFSFWPTERSVTAEKMNYAVLITGAIVIISLVYYQVWAKRVYTGPVIELSWNAMAG